MTRHRNLTASLYCVTSRYYLEMTSGMHEAARSHGASESFIALADHLSHYETVLPRKCKRESGHGIICTRLVFERDVYHFVLDTQTKFAHIQIGTMVEASFARSQLRHIHRAGITGGLL